LSTKKVKKIFPFILVIIFTGILLAITGCGGMSKMIGTATMLGKEVEEVSSMSAADFEKLISSDIDINRIKNDPEGILGKYVRVTGKADFEGGENFKMNMPKTKAKDEPIPFILDGIAFVMPVKKYQDVKQGDMVEVTALVSKSRFMKAVAEMYPKEKMPDLVTLIAKDVQLVSNLSAPEPAAAGTQNGVEIPGQAKSTGG
jgi:hypothetical protein